MPEWYDAFGNPLPAMLNKRGHEPGSVADKADQRLLNNPDLLTKENPFRQPPAPPGAVQRYLQGLGVPTDIESFKRLTTDTALNAATLGQYTPLSQAYNALQTGVSQGPVAGVNTMNPVVPLGEAIIDKNYAGAAGMATPYALSVAGAALPKIPGWTISKAKQGGRPIYGNGPLIPDTPLLESTLGVVSPRLAHGLSFIRNAANRVTRGKPTAYQLYDEPIGPTIPPPPLAVDTLKAFEESLPTTPAIPGAGRVPRPAQPTSPVPVDPSTIFIEPPLMNFGTPTLGAVMPESTPMPSPPLRSGQDWFQPPVEAAYGNAPRQTAAGPIGQTTRANQVRAARSLDDAGMAARFEPGDLSSRVTGDMAPPPLNPQELAGVKSQVRQTADAQNPFKPLSEKTLPSVGFTPNKFQELMNWFQQLLPESEPLGTIPPGKHLQDYRTSQLAKIEAEKMGWDRDALHSPGARPRNEKHKLQVLEDEKNANIIDRTNKKPKK